VRGGDRLACCRLAEGGRADPLTEEANSLQSRAAEARRHADESKRAFEALSARSWKDDEEATKVRKERDKLL